MLLSFQNPKKTFYSGVKLLCCLFLFLPLCSQAQDYREALFTYAAVPAVADTNDLGYQVLMNDYYAVGYSDSLRNPLWVCYRLGNSNSSEWKARKWERPNRFLADSRTETKIDHDAYTSSGYDRGHMAPNSSFGFQYGQMAQYQTYFMSNISPQTPSLNRGVWKTLESDIAELSQSDKKNKEVHDVYVTTGPIFDPNQMVTMDSGVVIPMAFYKIVAFRRGYLGTVKAAAFIIPQNPDSKKPIDYTVTIDEIELATGLDFFSTLSNTRQKNLESVKRDFDHELIED